jgi:hypothetical protein
MTGETDTSLARRRRTSATGSVRGGSVTITKEQYQAIIGRVVAKQFIGDTDRPSDLYLANTTRRDEVAWEPVEDNTAGLVRTFRDRF